MLDWHGSPPVISVFWSWRWDLWRKLTSSGFIWEIAQGRHLNMPMHTSYHTHRWGGSVVEFPACHVQGLRFSPQHYLHISTCMCAHTEIYLGLSHLLKCENEKKFEQVTKLFCKSNISPPFLRNYLLSSSEDGTVRLWSLQTFTCLVGYKGHNYPVWDTQFSPYGYYFVSGGHDRVAR